MCATADSGQQRRRLTAAPLTAVALATGLVLAPGVAYAVERMITVISDPHVEEAQTRVSSDGRLAVRGEVTQQMGLPTNEWDAALYVNAASPGPGRLLWGAPPGSGVGISQVTVSGSSLNSDAPGSANIWLVARYNDGPCPAEKPPGYGRGEELIWQASVGTGSGRAPLTQQFTFPVPLTYEPSPTRGVCVFVSSWGRDASISANGLTGPGVPEFTPPIPGKGAAVAGAQG